MSRQKIWTSLLVITVVTLLVVLAFHVKTGTTGRETGSSASSSKGCCGGNQGGCGVKK